MKKRVIRTLFIIAALLIAWFPVAWFAELGHNPITSAFSFHPIGSVFRVVKAILEFPLSWSGPNRPVNSAVLAFGIYLAVWTPIIMLVIECASVIKKRRSTGLPNKK